MGIGDWFKKTFGKQPCAFCGNEVGMMKRDKIRNKEFICHDCRRTCSRYISVYRYTKEELLGHMEYMKRQGKLVESVQDLRGDRRPSAGKQGFIFYDEVGMFRIYDLDKDDRYLWELIRYDHVAKYEPYLEESEPSEPGKPKEFGECGVRITLVGAQDDQQELKKGLRAHPYIQEEITVRIEDRNKERGMLEVDSILRHFDFIFGVHDDTKGLFNFGPTKQQKREMDAMKAVGGMFKDVIQAARTGEVSAETVAQAQEAMNKVEDAATSGLGRFSRAADAAEAAIH